MLWPRHVSVASLLGVALFVGIAYGSPGRPAGRRTAPAAHGAPGVRAKYVPDQLLVRFRSGVDKLAMRAEHAQAGAAVLRAFRVVENLQLVRLPAGTSVKQAARYYRARPDVLYAEPNYFRYIDQAPVTPNDPGYLEMWNLHNTGQFGGAPGADIHAPEAWGLTTGSSSVVVAVIDTGIYSHPDLAANVWSSPTSYTVTLNGKSITCAAGTHGFNAITQTCDPEDDNSHGTHVAGTIGASGNNGTGVVGVNWQVQVMACKFLDSTGRGTTADQITCLEYLTIMKDRGVNLVATNNSYGGAGFSQAEVDAINSHRQRGILFIAAAGNARAKNDLVSFYPANYGLPHMISVAASDRSDALADFSNFGRHSVHLSAPGKEILSTIPPNDYAVYSGTSMAAPHVTGVAALLKAQDPARDWKAIKNLILAGGDTVPSLSNTITQKRLNAYGAMTCSNSVVQSRLLPITTTDAYVQAGDSLTFSVLNINCAAPNGLLEVPVDGGPGTITLSDDGVWPDLEANDGIYVAQRQWFASEVGDHTLAFPNNDVVTVHVIPPLASYTYSTAVPFKYRDIVGTDVPLGDDDSAPIHPPFPVQFGGAAFPTLYVNSNGNVTFFGPFAEWDNSPLPATGTATLVAPFWDDLIAYGTGSSVRWAVTGAAPNRELVIEWHKFYHMLCFALPTTDVTFQIVFFEGSSDILFNYADVFFGPFILWGVCFEEVNGGAEATVGVQCGMSRANEFSFNTASLSDGSSILWQLGQQHAAITRLSPFALLAGASGVPLGVIGRSFVPGAVVRWNGSDRPTTFVNGGELRADIPASDLASPGSAQITVFNAPPSGSDESAPASFNVYSSYPVPTLTGVSPNPVPSGVNVILTLTGTNFVPGSVGVWKGLAFTSTVLSSTRLQMTSPSEELLPLGTAQISVHTPAPGGGSSNALPVNVVNPVPVIRGLIPSRVGVGAPTFELQPLSYNIALTSVIRWNGSDRPTSFDGSFHATIPATDVASIGTAEITVFTPPPGGGTSKPVTLSIVAPPANDKFANATVISTYPFTQTEDAGGALREPLDPQPPCDSGTPQETVWFRFTPPAAGAVLTVDTFASNYGAVLSAWTGSPGNLVNAGCNGYNSFLSVSAASTSPIYFMVSTPAVGFAGKLVFNLNVGPGFKLGSNPTTITVPHGSPATYMVTIAPQFGSFNDPIALSCSVAPYGPKCSLSPAWVTPGGASISATLTVDTTKVAQLAKRDVPGPGFAFWLALPAIGLLAARRIPPGKKKSRFGLALALVLMAAVLGMPTGCGGGGGGGNPPPPQTQNFTITVTGTSGTISQQTSVSLTITP